MNDTSFDRAMRERLRREDESISTARLEQAFSCLGDVPGVLASEELPPRAASPMPDSSNQDAVRPAGARRTAPLRRAHGSAARRPKRRAMVLTFALLTLLAATALAATLGLARFFDQNPYLFAHQPGETTDAVEAQPLLLVDGSGLRDLRVQPVDSAWIDGYLTLSVLVSPADADEPLLVGELNGDGTASLYQDGPGQPPKMLDDAASARILLHDDFSVYTLAGDGGPDDGGPDDGWSGYPQIAETLMQEDGSALIALQINPDFVTVSDLGTLARDGRFPFRLEMYLADHGELRAESAILSAVLPTDEEKEVMTP